jgi:hypothetical protein
MPAGHVFAGVQFGAPQKFGIPPPPHVVPAGHGSQVAMPPQPLPVWPH